MQAHAANTITRERPTTGRAVVAFEPGAPTQLVDVEIDQLGPGEVQIRLVATGVCHTDLHVWKWGFLGYPAPVLLGHEGAGVVEATGDDVIGVARGDRVVISWRVPCGRCGPCARGLRGHCQSPVSASPRLRLADTKRVLTPVLNTGTFATRTVVDARQAIKIPDAIALEKACLLACGVVTGVGATRHTSPVWPGATVVVIGCGAVGLNVVQGARLAGAGRIIAVDTNPAKLDHARRFGATHTVHARAGNTVEQVRELGADGVDFAYDAVGAPGCVADAIAVLGVGGTATMIGVPGADDRIDVAALPFFGAATTLRSCHGGDCDPADFLPSLARDYLDGRLELDALVTREIGLEDVPAAFDAMKGGDVVRSVIRLEEEP
jgi:S-(hydroxymethyl)mycothiol dehydrogenase